MSDENELVVSSHVGRDLLQSANIFKTADVAVWEYIVNGLQYVHPGTSPTVVVDVDNRAKKITISDNGTGMDEKALSHFFTMHGENVERKRGSGGRGKYGTGKSAAFGIARKLVVDTTRNGIRNRVELDQQAIKDSDGTEIPVNRTAVNVPNPESDGTTIIIEEIILPKVDSLKIIKKIEKHLQSYRHINPQVLVGDHLCTYGAPTIDESIVVQSDAPFTDYLGDVELLIHIATSPLSAEDRGIAVSCGVGNLVAIEDAGVCQKEMGEYLFGEINVPQLEDNEHETDAFDASRDMRLRQEHPVVGALIGFIGTKLEEQRKVLVKKKREASKIEANRQLHEQAEKIAELLNKDFSEINEKLQKIRSSRRAAGGLLSKFGGEDGASDDPDGWVRGITERGDIEDNPAREGESNSSKAGREDPNITVSGKPNPDGQASVDPVSASSSGRKRQPRGGFSVEYEHMGIAEDRAKYLADKGKFIINLDHPVVMSAEKALGTEDIGFIRLSHEIIFAEYAFALASMAAADDPDIPADDVVYDARETLNRVSAKSAILYQD
jgi:hypothetical protein